MLNELNYSSVLVHIKVINAKHKNADQFPLSDKMQ